MKKNVDNIKYKIVDPCKFKKAIEKLYKDGENDKSISKKIGVASSTVNHWINRNSKPRDDITIKKIIEEFNLSEEDIGATKTKILVNNFSKKLKELLIENKKTKKDLANKLSVDISIISRYCSGEREPSLNNLIEISNIFNVSCDYLIVGVIDENYNGITSKDKDNLDKLIKANYQKKYGGLFPMSDIFLLSELDIIKYMMDDFVNLRDFTKKIWEYYNIEKEWENYVIDCEKNTKKIIAEKYENHIVDYKNNKDKIYEKLKNEIYKEKQEKCDKDKEKLENEIFLIIKKMLLPKIEEQDKREKN